MDYLQITFLLSLLFVYSFQANEKQLNENDLHKINGVNEWRDVIVDSLETRSLLTLTSFAAKRLNVNKDGTMIQGLKCIGTQELSKGKLLLLSKSTNDNENSQDSIGSLEILPSPKVPDEIQSQVDAKEMPEITNFVMDVIHKTGHPSAILMKISSIKAVEYVYPHYDVPILVAVVDDNQYFGYLPNKPLSNTKRVFDMNLLILEPVTNVTYNFVVTVTSFKSGEYKMSAKLYSEVVDSQKSKRAATTSSSDTIKMMSYNIWNYASDWDSRKIEIAKIAREQNPDLVAWQEIREKWNVPASNQLDQLAALIPGYQWMYHIAMHGLDNEEEGLGIFIRKGIEVIKQKAVKLPRASDCPDANTRILFMIELDYDGKIFYFVDTHWSYERICQLPNAEVAWNHLKNISTPMWIMGDFNTYDDYETPMDFFTGKIEINGNKGDFTDTYESLKPNGNFNTFPSKGGKPNVRPDRILGRKKDFVPATIEIIGNKPFRKDPDGNDYPSDHLGVVAQWKYVKSK